MRDVREGEREMDMDLKTFDALAELHGGDLAAWPPGAQAPARALLARSAAARAALERAAALDAALADLAAFPEPPASDALMARILADADAALAAQGGGAPAAAAPSPITLQTPPRAARAPAFRDPRRRRTGPVAALRRWSAPALAAAASALLGVALGWNAPDPLRAAVYGDEAAAVEEIYLSAELLPAFDAFPTEARP